MSDRRPPGGVETAREVLTTRMERWARDRPDRIALIFLDEREVETARLTFADLHAAATRLAGALGATEAVGRTALLFAGSNPDFVVQFLACLLAGIVAVPCSAGHSPRGWDRTVALVRDAQPAIALGTARDSRLLHALRELGVPTLEGGCTRPDHGMAAPIDAEAPAFLQYTSGSTGAPKGVVITHRNLAANLEMLRTSFDVRDDSIYLSWLPLFHDMGLVGNLLAALYCGVPCVLMPPIAFYKQPRRWFAAIGRYRATISGGPNFAYELSVRRFERLNLDGIDLRAWRLAFCGAEMVRPDTMTRFAALFGRAGFDAAALYPCYGLAEATVFVAGVECGSGVRTARSPDGLLAVCCGRPAPGGEVLIVDPQTARPTPDGEVGEIQVRGDHVSPGYWGKLDFSRETMAARSHPLATSPSLLTGDLGWIADGELFIAGRRDDMIVYRGTNIHPEDIEDTAARSHESFSAVTAAFPVLIGNEEQIVVVQELARPASAALDPASAIGALIEAVVLQHDIHAYDAVVVEPNTIPRTTSGKVQRRRCRELYEQRLLDRVILDRLGRFVRS